ncbi:MAG TPA: TetR/AcrR family transcriptional regulator [Acidimicrobiales bacterium]|nr:TetR/AcrR family transcriptional regulator [Acidimicrobiales bacterium]
MAPTERQPHDVLSARRAARRAELLDAAIRAIRQGGGHAAMEDIAAEAGISRPILYRHFDDATGVYAAVADRFCTELLARLRRSAREERPGRRLLRRQIVTYLAFIAEDPDVYRFLMRQVPPDRPRPATHRSGFSRLVADNTAQYLVEAGWDPARAVAGADLFIGGLEAAASRWVEEPAGSYEELADQLTDVLWSGFRHARLVPAPTVDAR